MLPGKVEKVMSPIFNKLDVAIHEAGHAVCNHFFGRATEKIVLTFRPALNEWHGETHAVPPKVRFRTNFSFGPAAPVEPPDISPLAAECVIAAAGYFAQVLKTGREVRPDLLLSVIQDWPSLLGWLYDKRLVTEKPEFPMAVTAGGKLACFTIPSRAFSSGDQTAYCSVWDNFEKIRPRLLFPADHAAFEKRLADDVARFFVFLNQSATWQAICNVSTSLFFSNASPAILEGAQVFEMMKKIGKLK